MGKVTSSAWGPAPSRYYAFLARLSSLSDLRADFDLAVLGCADGKFVLPAARRHLGVLAVDIDPIALYGGKKPGIGGEVNILGLQGRLTREGLLPYVETRCTDFRYASPSLSRAVFVSGAIQYSFNMPDTAADILKAVIAHVAPGGLLYIDYMLPFEWKYRGRPNCPPPQFWREWPLQQEGWRTLWNRVLPPVRDRAHIEYPVDHFHQWGHLLMQRAACC